MKLYSHIRSFILSGNSGKMAVLFAMIIVGVKVYAQSGTNSPYSQYGLGVLADQSTGFNRGMNGVGYGFHDGNQINYLNPASYAHVDSLTFLFDMGLSGQFTTFTEGKARVTAKNANFEYAVAGFRLGKRLGMSFGILPYTNVGYKYTIQSPQGAAVNYTNSYSGSGGLHEAYVGVGFAPVKNFSLGVNFGYLWGNTSRSINNVYTSTTANTLAKIFSADVRNYMLNVGLLYDFKIRKQDVLSVGLTYGLGHDIGGTPSYMIISTNGQTSVADTTHLNAGALSLSVPTVFGGGLMYNHANKVRLGMDLTMQQWSKASFPDISRSASGEERYVMQKGLFMDRYKVVIGADFVPSPEGRNVFARTHYRFGIGYATPYYKINGHDGPSEWSASAGFGIPIINTYNNRTFLNISAQWVRTAASGFIKENMFRINIGLTFNEKWFQKWKVD